MKKPLAEIIEAVEAALAATPGILDAKWLGEAERQGVQELEEALEKEGRGLAGACLNEGVMEVLGRRQVCAVLNNEFRHASEPALAWVAGDLIIGEEICDRKKSEGEVRLECRGFGSGHDPESVVHCPMLFSIFEAMALPDPIGHRGAALGSSDLRGARCGGRHLPYGGSAGP